MAVLTGPEIMRQIGTGSITITPPPPRINPNSVNLSLYNKLKVYNIRGSIYQKGAPWSPSNPGGYVDFLDPRLDNPTIDITIPDDGYVLRPGIVYLAATIEFTETFGFVPVLEGRSSIGRLGLAIHICAGYGDTGFCGRWTCELEAIHPVLVLPGQQICQLSFHTVQGDIQNYNGKYNGLNEPTSSKLWQEMKNPY